MAGGIGGGATETWAKTGGTAGGVERQDWKRSCSKATCSAVKMGKPPTSEGHGAGVCCFAAHLVDLN